MLVEEGPRRDDGDEGKGGAAEAKPDGELDVLEEVSDEEGNCLSMVSTDRNGARW